MMKFTLGLCIFAFTLIMGIYNFNENKSVLARQQAGLRDMIDRKEQASELLRRFEEIKNKSLKSGDDQKFTIERQLGIGEGGLEFRFLGQSGNENGEPLYNHTFSIQGTGTFDDMLAVLQQLAAQPGYAVYRMCFACDRMQLTGKAPLKKGHYSITIEGFLYVYDPNAILS